MTETRKATTETFEDLKAILEYILEPTVNYNEALYRLQTIKGKDLIAYKKTITNRAEWEPNPMTWQRLLRLMRNEWFRKPSAMRNMIDSFIRYDSSFPGCIPSRRMCGIKRGD